MNCIALIVLFFLESAFANNSTEKKSLYADLEVSKSATPDEIKSAYRRLSKIYHPDHQGEIDSETLKNNVRKQQEINAAYEVLSDPEKRSLYDRGIEWVNPNQQKPSSDHSVDFSAYDGKNRVQFLRDLEQVFDLMEKNGTPYYDFDSHFETFSETAMKHFKDDPVTLDESSQLLNLLERSFKQPIDVENPGVDFWKWDALVFASLLIKDFVPSLAKLLPLVLERDGILFKGNQEIDPGTPFEEIQLLHTHDLRLNLMHAPFHESLVAPVHEIGKKLKIFDEAYQKSGLKTNYASHYQSQISHEIDFLESVLDFDHWQTRTCSKSLTSPALLRQ